MHANVKASHDRSRLDHRESETSAYVAMDDVYAALGDEFCIISLRDDYGIASAYSEQQLNVHRGYRYFIDATVEAILGVEER